MRGLMGERTLMRIYIDETDRWKGHVLYEAILHTLRERGMAGATIIGSIMSFGSRRILHSELNEITSMDRPVIVECVDAEERILAVLPMIDPMMTSGLVTLERANVVVYRAPQHPDHPNAAAPAVPEG